MQNSERAIIKFINYETPDSIAKAQKTRDYICSDKRTSPEYIFTHALYADNIPESLATIEEKWHPGGHRAFKQLIFSFGQRDLTPEKAIEVTKDIMEFYRQYPWLAAIHTNCLHRIHTHCILGCTNLETGHKMSQSRKDLRNFRDYYDEVAKKYGLPLLSGNLYATRPNASLEEQTAGRYEEEYIDFNNFQWTTADNYGSYQILKTVPNANPYNISPTTNIQNLSAIQNVNAILEPIINIMRDDMQYFFDLGYGGNENE